MVDVIVIDPRAFDDYTTSSSHKQKKKKKKVFKTACGALPVVGFGRYVNQPGGKVIYK